MKLNLKRPIVFFDLETTGVDTAKDRIVEISMVKVMPDGVAVDNGQVVEAQAILWTTGVRVSPIAAAAGLVVDDRGRIVTDHALRSVTHPNIYAVGDAAAIRQGFRMVALGTDSSYLLTAAQAALAASKAKDDWA